MKAQHRLGKISYHSTLPTYDILKILAAFKRRIRLVINKIVLKNFKKFKHTPFDLNSSGLTFLAGANNSGKSTLLQAMAVWEFCKIVLEMERGRESLLTGYSKQGLGLSDDEFSPIAIANLKHLWTNLRNQEPGAPDGYSLGVHCDWKDSAGVDKHLQITLALANDRLFIKVGATNLTLSDTIPSFAYLPPFAGIESRESFMSVAQRRAMTGRGLAGGVIRNLLHDMHRVNEAERAKLKAGRTKIKDSDLARLRASDPWEILQSILAEVFNTQLEVEPFNSLYHSYIRVKCFKGKIDGKKFVRHPKFIPRDLMAEGSGLLQWLSVFALALDKSINTILLDEPDAHLHTSLQNKLVDKLDSIAQSAGKQIIMATHSTEILRAADYAKILGFKGSSAKYLANSDGKIPLFLGLGSEYSPKLDPLRKGRRLLIVENMSDERILRIFSKKLGCDWPENLVTWPWTGSNKERKQLFLQLKPEMPGIKVISLRDRDDSEINTIDKETLIDKSFGNLDGDLSLCVWRRRHIENYLLFPPAIARVAAVPEADIVDFMTEHALVVPANFVSKDVALAMLDARGKEIVQEGENSIKKKYKILPHDIAEAMLPAEVPDDIRTLINKIQTVCA
jgi:hypothetical protein